MEKYPGLDRIIAEMKSADEASIPGSPDRGSWTQSDALCYALIEEMGSAGLSCLVYTGSGGITVTYCQLRRNAGADCGGDPSAQAISSLGTQVLGIGPEATRAAICRAYIAFRLRSKGKDTGSPEFLLPREG